MSEETCSYFSVQTGGREKSTIVILLCKQLDEIGVTYTFTHRKGNWDFGPATFINFDEEQSRDWIEKNIHMGYYTPSIKEFEHEVIITSGNLIECDNWLLENFGLMEDEWTSNFDDKFNVYHFKEDTDAMAFKLKFS